ncbi:MAG: hypothetical protein KA099_10030 [Alphaproteobacteria bacterium]|nr:hypothetical protein [Alphaproteobacteria bacterium]MBP7759391.1 hypothetical protein [Alphaproteobacteria bacterium]MBP7762668.1 hypothetical protein [Alphaproteobacteria bacterium]MBP7905651.1 hypothetical protein [Alphaproteobacteria bacterium]
MVFRFRVILLLSAFIVCGVSGAASGAEKKPAKPVHPPKAETVKETVKLSSQIDAYNAFCQKDSALSQGVIKRFVPETEAKRREELGALKDTSFKAAKMRLDEKKYACDSPDFLMEKFSIMQQLKILFAEILRVDPAKQKLDGSPLPPPPKEILEQNKKAIPPSLPKEEAKP